MVVVLLVASYSNNATNKKGERSRQEGNKAGEEVRRQQEGSERQ